MTGSGLLPREEDATETALAVSILSARRCRAASEGSRQAIFPLIPFEAPIGNPIEYPSKLLWNITGATPEQQAINTLASGLVRPALRASRRYCAGFHPGVIDLRLTLVARMLVRLQHGFQAVAQLGRRVRIAAIGSRLAGGGQGLDLPGLDELQPLARHRDAVRCQPRMCRFIARPQPRRRQTPLEVPQPSRPLLQRREPGRASVPASPDYLASPKMFGLARTLALPSAWHPQGRSAPSPTSGVLS